MNSKTHSFFHIFTISLKLGCILKIYGVLNLVKYDDSGFCYCILFGNDMSIILFLFFFN